MSDDSGGVNPVPGTPVVTERPPEAPPERQNAGVARLWEWVKTISVGAWIVVLLLLVMEKTIQWHSLLVDPIEVPKTLAEAGFSTEVVTQHLRDAIKELQNRAPTSIKRHRVDVSESIPDITIPTLNVSVGVLASLLHPFLPEDWQHEIAGEFVVSGSEVYVRMRLNDELVFSKKGAITAPDEVDIPIDKAALKILEITEPSIPAAYLLTIEDVTDATRLADQVITSPPADKESVKWAYVIKGLISQLTDKPDEAISDYNNAIERDPKFAEAHVNLGNALRQEGKLHEAISEYNRGIQLDPKSPVAHVNLGNAFRLQGKLDEAISEYRRAIQLNPNFVPAYHNLGATLLLSPLHLQGRRDDAISEFHRAIELDPKDAGVHDDLGIALFQEGKLDDAVSEYRRANLLDPKLKTAHPNLSDLLRQKSAPDQY